MKCHRSHQLAIAAIAAAAVCGVKLFEVSVSASAEEGPADLVQRVVAEISRTDMFVRATRHLRAGTRNGKHAGWMDVDTVLTPSGGFAWTVLEEGGSERTRNKVFRELLTAEQQSRRSGRDDAAITFANYAFERLDSVASEDVQIRLKPKRADSRLIDGVLTVSRDGYPILIEGTLAKSPSFWVKSVSVTNRFDRIAGVSLPTTVESVADVRMVGPAAFTMRYEYSEVNGRRVAPHAEAPDPDVELLALLSPGPR